MWHRKWQQQFSHMSLRLLLRDGTNNKISCATTRAANINYGSAAHTARQFCEKSLTHLLHTRAVVLARGNETVRPRRQPRLRT